MNAGHAARAGHGARPDRTPVIPSPHHHVLAFSVRLSPRVRITTVWGYLRHSPDQRLTSHPGPGRPGRNPVPRARA